MRASPGQLEAQTQWPFFVLSFSLQGSVLMGVCVGWPDSRSCVIYWSGYSPLQTYSHLFVFPHSIAQELFCLWHESSRRRCGLSCEAVWELLPEGPQHQWLLHLSGECSWYWGPCHCLPGIKIRWSSEPTQHSRYSLVLPVSQPLLAMFLTYPKHIFLVGEGVFTFFLLGVT